MLFIKARTGSSECIEIEPTLQLALPTNMMYLTIQHPTTDFCLIYRSPSAPRKHVSAHSQEVPTVTSLRRRARFFTNHPSYTRNSYFFLPANPIHDFSFASLGLLLSFLQLLWPLLQDLSSAFPAARSMGISWSSPSSCWAKSFLHTYLR